MLLIGCEPPKHINMERICPKIIFAGTHDTAIEFRMLLLINNNLLNFKTFYHEHKWWKTAMLDLSIFRLYSRFFDHVYLMRGITQSLWIGISRRLDQKSSGQICLLTLMQKRLALTSTLASSFVLLGVGKRILSATCDNIDSVVIS